MFIKITQTDSQSDESTRTIVLECKRYEKIFHPEPTQSPMPPRNYTIREDVIYAYSDDYSEEGSMVSPRDEHFFYELWAYDDNKEPIQILLRDAIVYVMNSEGKTIDKMYA